MKISDNNLIPSLDNKLQNIYVLLADDSVRIKECLDKIYSKAKLELFTEKETYVIESKTKWDFLTSESSNLDMFGSKKIIEIKLLGQGPGIKGSKALKDYAKEPDSNILLIVTAEGLDKKSFSSAWLKALEEAGVIISMKPFSKSDLLSWIEQKGNQNGIKISKDAKLLLVEKTEGNLMATLQEINKLSLIFPSEEIDFNRMKKAITNSSSFDIFDFSNAFISGNKEKAVRILESLKLEGTPESLIIWALERELNNLFKVIKTGTVSGIWGPKNYLDKLKNSAQKVEKEEIYKAFKEIALIDCSIKGHKKQNPWLGIRNLTLTF